MTLAIKPMMNIDDFKVTAKPDNLSVVLQDKMVSACRAYIGHRRTKAGSIGFERMISRKRLTCLLLRRIKGYF